jgi:hypothetical protein
MELIEIQIDGLRKAATFISTRWKARARVVTSASSADDRRREYNEQQERDRPDDRELERDYVPELEREVEPPEYPFQDFNYGP